MIIKNKINKSTAGEPNEPQKNLKDNKYHSSNTIAKFETSIQIQDNNLFKSIQINAFAQTNIKNKNKNK